MPLVAALALFFVLAFVWPLVRLKRRSGVWAVVSHRGADPCQRLVGALVALWLGAVGAWGALVATVGPGALGVWAAPPPVARAGWALVAVGLALTVWAQAAMGASWRIGIDDRPTALVTRGPYAVSRNPIYTAMLIAFAGVALVTPSAWTIAGWVAVAQLIAVQVRLEEQHLGRLHGDAFRDWAMRVGRFVPGVGILR
jgi:protein-S-isoprenylcysteine O-methyltransferase Ste14